ncbi:hydroxyacid dehydrogenase [Oleiharenicola lentus]|jgi:phosphoglycerate dehydrogenase-like enzyme|uniref:Hydroxyacid dehydrogenase n=1 Tax=Oleiharenicola lentus TaxID=2508720 RepID=A0A4Q1C6W4_9BACT|nr:hydroxyacid dehydrogenase [Oleiharenicola lentus]RXK54536.1 hydroxyacid dehydrogenase [Oleiharenicola lentus]
MNRRPAVFAAVTDAELLEFLPEPLLGEVRALAGSFTACDPTAGSVEDFHAALAAANPEVLVGGWKTPALPATLPPNLRYVCYLCGSVRRLVTRPQLEAGLTVTNWGGSISRIVAEWALFHILSCLRRATYWTIAMHHEGAWKNGGSETASLFGRRVGLHGFGQIARELVQLLRPFGTPIMAFAPDVTPGTAPGLGLACAGSLEELFAENDIIVELAPLNDSTRGIVREEHLRLVRPGGVFVNVGRGAVVDEAALLRVAQEGRIQIGLDVYTVEPLPADSPFRGLRNVTLTPHIAGPTTDRRRDAGAFALANLRAYCTGRPLQAVVTPEVYDTAT